MKVLLCSNSSLKLAGTKIFINTLSDDKIDLDIDTVDCDELKLPSQPLNCADSCAKERLNYGKQKTFPKEYDYMIAIESGIINGHEECVAIIEHKGAIGIGIDSFKIRTDYLEYLNKLEKIDYVRDNQNVPKINEKITGYNKTLGEFLCPSNSKNWMKEIVGIDRLDMITQSLDSAFKNLVQHNVMCRHIKNSYKEYENFPKPGVLFYDIFAVLSNTYATHYLEKVLEHVYSYDTFDYVVGLESRGFFGILLSRVTNTGFIPIRKVGKLPGKTEKIEYGTEYSKDIMEISTDIPKGSRVIVFDDLIATGGSLRAAIDLLEKLECVVVDCCVLREVTPLRSKAKETLNRSYTVLISSD